MAKEYIHGDVLVSTDWVEQHLNDPQVRAVESDEDVLLYHQGHVPGAVRIDWHIDLQDQIVRDYVDKAHFAKLCASKGIANDTTVVFYGDKNNWWACYAFWVFKLFGHADCKIMNGGRKRWELDGKAWSREPEQVYPKTDYTPAEPDLSIRAFREEVLKHQRAGKPLIDVRSPGEFSGELLHMPDYPQEGALRGGHIPGAKNVPWAKAANEDGTFKSAKELEKLYVHEAGLSRRGLTIAYCRIGERSSHTWFVLHYLLGFPKVKNYDGSWTEWGNAVGLPIDRGAGEPDPRYLAEQGDAAAARRASEERDVSAAVSERVEQLSQEFAELDKRERLELLLEFSERLAPLPPELAAERDAGMNRVTECQTPVFLWVRIEAGRVKILAEVAPEAPTVKGFVSLLVELFSGATPTEVLSVEPNLVHEFGLAEVLGMVRLRGLMAILYVIRRQISQRENESPGIEAARGGE